MPARNGAHTVQDSVQQMLSAEPRGEVDGQTAGRFQARRVLSKLRLLSMLRELKEKGARIAGISAPSRA